MGIGAQKMLTEWQPDHEGNAPLTVTKISQERIKIGPFFECILHFQNFYLKC